MQVLAFRENGRVDDVLQPVEKIQDNAGSALARDEDTDRSGFHSDEMTKIEGVSVLVDVLPRRKPVSNNM